MKKAILSKWILAGGACAGLLAVAPAEAQRRSGNGEQALAHAIAGRAPGRPVNCINLRTIRSSRIIDRTAIVYDAGRTIYVNRPRSGATSLDDHAIMVSRTSGSQLCAIETIRLVDRGSRTPRGFVTLDRFVPYTRRGDAR